MGHGSPRRALGSTDTTDFSVLEADRACVVLELHFSKE